MKEVTGNLIQLFNNGTFDVIIHGANCQSTMGSGIAVQIKKHFPSAFEADYDYKCSPEEKLGNYSFTRVDRHDGTKGTIFNAYTQLGYGRGLQVSYPAMAKSFKAIANHLSLSSNMPANKVKIGYPGIGFGLGGGDRNIILPLIDIAFEGLDHTLVIYDQKS